MEAIILFCMVDKKSIPLDRLQRGCLSCSKECGAELKRRRRKLVDLRKCHHCSKPSTQEQRASYRRWWRQLPENQGRRRGRPRKAQGKPAPAGQEAS